MPLCLGLPLLPLPLLPLPLCLRLLSLLHLLSLLSLLPLPLSRPLLPLRLPLYLLPLLPLPLLCLLPLEHSARHHGRGRHWRRTPCCTLHRSSCSWH